MAAPSCVRDETRDKTYSKISVKERKDEEVKHVRGMTMKQIGSKRRTTGGGHMEKS